MFFIWQVDFKQRSVWPLHGQQYIEIIVRKRLSEFIFSGTVRWIKLPLCTNNSCHLTPIKGPHYCDQGDGFVIHYKWWKKSYQKKMKRDTSATSLATLLKSNISLILPHLFIFNKTVLINWSYSLNRVLLAINLLTYFWNPFVIFQIWRELIFTVWLLNVIAFP